MEGVQFIGEDEISVRTGGRFHFLAFSSQPLDNQDTSNNQKQKFQTPKLDYIFPWYDKGGIERPSTELQRHNLDTKTIYVTVTHHQPILEVALSAGAGWVVAIPKATSSVGGALGLSSPFPAPPAQLSLIVLPSLTSFSEDQNGTMSFLGILEPLSWVQTEVSTGEASPSLLSPQPGHADSHSQEDSQTGPTRPQGCFRGSYLLLSVLQAPSLPVTKARRS